MDATVFSWGPTLFKAGVGTLFSLGGYLIMFPLRTLIKSVKAEWASKAQLLEQVHQELTTQRTNCLTTIQQNTQKTNELLEKAVETLGDMRLSQEHMVGYLEASKKQSS